MTDSYYECHITFMPVDAPDGGSGKVVESDVTELNWKFSAIDGDIIQGPGVKYYATRHMHADTPIAFVLSNMLHVAQLLADKGYIITRRKIEHVIYDDRSSKICPPSCEECIKLSEA